MNQIQQTRTWHVDAQYIPCIRSIAAALDAETCSIFVTNRHKTIAISRYARTAASDVGHRHSKHEGKLHAITRNDKHQPFCNLTSSTFPALGLLLEVLSHSLALLLRALLPGYPSRSCISAAMRAAEGLTAATALFGGENSGNKQGFGSLRVSPTRPGRWWNFLWAILRGGDCYLW